MQIDWDELLPPMLPEKASAGGAAEPMQEPVPDAGIAARERDGDNRRRCIECGNLGERGICMAAQRGQFVASRNYTPVRDILRRCEGFAPLPTDPDQRYGLDKWGCLADCSRPKDATV